MTAECWERNAECVERKPAESKARPLMPAPGAVRRNHFAISRGALRGQAHALFIVVRLVRVDVFFAGPRQLGRPPGRQTPTAARNCQQSASSAAAANPGIARSSG